MEVCLGANRSSVSAVWAVHLHNGEDGVRLLLHSAAYGRYLAATNSKAPPVDEPVPSNLGLMLGRELPPWRLIKYVRAADDGSYNQQANAWTTFQFRGNSVGTLRNEVASRAGITDVDFVMCIEAGRQGRLTPMLVNMPREGHGDTVYIVIIVSGTPVRRDALRMDVYGPSKYPGLLQATKDILRVEGLLWLLDHPLDTQRMLNLSLPQFQSKVDSSMKRMKNNSYFPKNPDHIIKNRKSDGVNNTYTFSLDGNRETVLDNFQNTIGWARTWCHSNGDVVDISAIYGPGREVFTTPIDGSMHITVEFNNEPLTLILEGHSLYIKAWRVNSRTFELTPENEEEYYTIDRARKVLPFTGNYRNLCSHLGKTRVGMSPLQSAHTILVRSQGKGTNEERDAIAIFCVNIAEAIRFQSVYRLVCESFWNFEIFELDSCSNITWQREPNSWWAKGWRFYCEQEMHQMHYKMLGFKRPISNRTGGAIQCAWEIARQIRVLKKTKSTQGVFKYTVLPPLVPKESPPNPNGVVLLPLRSVLEEFDSQARLCSSEENFEEWDCQGDSEEHVEEEVELRRRKDFLIQFPMVGRLVHPDRTLAKSPFSNRFLPVSMRGFHSYEPTRRFHSYEPPKQQHAIHVQEPIVRPAAALRRLFPLNKATSALMRVIRFLR